MKLGDKVYFIDPDGNAIRKGVVTHISIYVRYIDYLSSKPHKTCTGVKYTVCALKDGYYYFFEQPEIFHSIQELKDHLFRKFEVFE